MEAEEDECMPSVDRRRLSAAPLMDIIELRWLEAAREAREPAVLR